VDAKLKKIGITGASGFIGRNLLNYLSTCGYDITGFTSSHGCKDLSFLDLNDVNQLESKLKTIEILIHSAWTGSDRKNRDIAEVQRRNINMVKNLVIAQKNTNITKIIGIGSQEELIDGDQPWSDDAKFNSSTEYGKAKHEIFSILSNSRMNFTWVRLFSVYGRNDKRDWIFTNAVKYINENRTASFGLCSKPWSLTHIDDILFAFELIIKNNIFGVLNLSNLEAPLLINHIQLLESLAGKRLFTFVENSIPERELSRTIGAIDTIGWEPRLSREERFIELLR
jgi:nucleoside-diphosphate-sugar epimerase